MFYKLNEQEINERYNTEIFKKIEYKCESNGVVYWTMIGFYKVIADMVFIDSYYLDNNNIYSLKSGKGVRYCLKAKNGSFTWNKKKIKL
jgi:hypothetical protein